MILLQTEIEGKSTSFGHARDVALHNGFSLCGSWEFDAAFFDTNLWNEGGETIYVRIPFHVLKGELDHRNAIIEFKTPFVIKHVVNIGLGKDENSFATVAGLSQFQHPVDQDGRIRDKSFWKEMAERSINELTQKLFGYYNESIS